MVNVFLTGMAVVDFVFSVEELPTRSEKYRANDAVVVGGGCAANAAVAVTRLGGHASLSARLGNDPLGELIIADLECERVNTQFIRRRNGARSAFSSVYVDATGERQIMNFRGFGLDDDPAFLVQAPKSDAFLADTRWISGAIKTMELACQQDVPGVIDAEAPVDPSILKVASHVAFSQQGLVELTGEVDLAKALALATEQIPGWACVTDGAAGVYFTDSGRIEHIPAFEVPVKDTLAAGDIWHGAFVLRLAEGADESTAIEFASAAAAIKCMKSGGREGCPDRHAVEKFLKEKT